jgi:hypothetical protein
MLCLNDTVEMLGNYPVLCMEAIQYIINTLEIEIKYAYISYSLMFHN